MAGSEGDILELFFDTDLISQVAGFRRGRVNFNSDLQSEIKAADELFRLAADEKLRIRVPDAVRRQVDQGDRDDEWQKAREELLNVCKISSYTIFPMKFPAKFITEEQASLYEELSEVKQKYSLQENDADLLLTAVMDGAKVVVTNDRKLRNNPTALDYFRKKFGLEIWSPSQALTEARRQT